MAIVLSNGKFGIVEQSKNSAEILIPFEYDSINEYDFPHYILKKDNKFGIVDITYKKTIIPCEYEEINKAFQRSSDEVVGFAEWGYLYRSFVVIYRVKKDGKYGFIDRTGKEVTPCIYENASDFEGFIAKVKKDGLWGCIDEKGKEVVPCIYEYVNTDSVFVMVRKNNKFGYVDKEGKEVVPCVYEDIEKFRGYYRHHGFCTERYFAPVKKDGKWGFVNIKGEETIPCIYTEVRDFNEGFARVKKDEKWGYVDETGKEYFGKAAEQIHKFIEEVFRVAFTKEIKMKKKLNKKLGKSKDEQENA